MDAENIPNKSILDYDSKRFKRIKLCVFLSGLSVFAQLYLFQPLLSLLCNEFEITPAKSSWAVSIATIGMATGLFILALKADALSRKKLMVFSMLASSIVTILSAFVFNFPLLIIMNFIKGLIISGVSSVALAYLSEEVKPAMLGFAISLYLSGNIMGGMFGRVIASLLSGWEWIGWRGATLFIGCLSLFFGLLFAKYFPESLFFTTKNTNIRDKIRQMKDFLLNFSMLRLYFIGALVMGSFVSVYNYLGFRLESPVFSLPHYLIAFVFLIYSMGVLGSIIAGKCSDKYRPSILIRVFHVAIILGLFLLLSTNLFLFITALGIFTFGFSAVHTLASRMVSQYTKENKSTATSLYWLFYYVGSSFVGSGTGIVYYHNNWTVFILVLLFLVSTSLILSSIKPKWLK